MQVSRVIRRPVVLHKTGFSASTIRNLEKSGAFPKHFLIGPRAVGWDEAEIDAWIAARRAARQA